MKLTQLMKNSKDFNEYLTVALENIAQTFVFERCSFLMLVDNRARVKSRLVMNKEAEADDTKISLDIKHSDNVITRAIASDTPALINDLEEDEIVAVLAHEIGHYKKKHIIFNLVASLLLTGFTLYILSLLISNPLLSQALAVAEPSFHIGLIAFAILYAPISTLTGLIMNWFSRKFEYQADDYAKNTYKAEPLISSLKKLSKNSLSNLTPHPAYVFMHYSHPTLLERFRNLNL